MRRSTWLALLATVSACGGAAATERPGTVDKTPENPSDPGFTDYAAAHGIQTLNGGGGETPEVTADGLRLEAIDKEKPVKLDGVPTEWPPFAKADVVVKGSTKSSMTIGLQYDDAKLYVGADIKDAAFAVGRDHVSLVLSIPVPSGTYATYELGLYAGKPGDSEGSVRSGGRVVPGAKIVEAPEAGGYTFEAVIPWSALPEGRSTRVGIHGAAGYVDGDAEIATGPVDLHHPSAMAWVPSEPELSMIEQFLAPKGLTKIAPSFEAVADLTGDGVRERIAVYEHYLTICGSSYLGGTGFFFRDMSGELVKLDVRDASGRGKGDVIVRRRVNLGSSTREYIEVLTAMGNSEEPKVTFAHEIAVRQSDTKHIDNAVRLGRGEIEVSVEPATNWDALSYQEPIANDVEPILFPWGPVRSQTWRWDGSHFARAKEVAQREQIPSGGTAEHPPPHPIEPPTPKVTRGGRLSDQVLDQYRRDRSVPPDVAPTADLRVQVAGDARPERVVLIGRDIVIFGPGFKGGTGYSYLTLAQFADPVDVTDMSARDLTGDGAADIIVRGVRHSRSDSGNVDSEVLFVYEVAGDVITRVFGIETARERSNKRVQGLVQFIPAPGNKSFDVLAAPGRAMGWTSKTYPWAQDPVGGADIEPVILPWSGIGAVRYRWNGSQFAKVGD